MKYITPSTAQHLCISTCIMVNRITLSLRAQAFKPSPGFNTEMVFDMPRSLPRDWSTRPQQSNLMKPIEFSRQLKGVSGHTLANEESRELSYARPLDNGSSPDSV